MSDRNTVGLFLAFGFAATAGQVLLLRLGMLLGGGNEIVLGAFFGAWFLGIAAGAAAGRRLAWRPGSFRPLAASFPFLLFLNALAVMVVAGVWAPAPGHLPSLGRGVLVSAALAVLPGAGIGLCFPAGAVAAGGVSRLFLLESAGSCAGGILASLVLLRINPLGMLAVFGAAGLALLPGRRRLLALGAGLGIWVAWGPLAELRLAAFHPIGKAIVEADSPYQHILLTEREGQYSVYLNGRLAGQFPRPDLRMRYGPYASLGRSVPQNGVLVGGIPGTEEDFQKAGGFHEVYHPQPDAVLRGVIDHIRGWKCAKGERIASYSEREELERIHWVDEDARQFFQNAGSSFDAVFVDLPAPTSVHENRVFTVEAFRGIARRTRPDGVVVVYLPVSENYWGDEVAGQVGALYRTMMEVFTEVIAVPGPVPALLASRSPLGKLGTAVRSIESGNGNWSDPAFAALAPALFSRDRREAFARRLERSPARPDTDDRPFGFLNSLAVREKQEGGLAIADAVMGLSSWALVVLALVAFIPYAPRRRRPLFQVFTTGALGIGAFLLLSIRFQAVHGTYYGAVWLLTGVFMLGLALSAPLGARMARRSAAPWLPDAAAVALLGLLWAVPWGPTPLSAVFFALAGVVTGLPFVFQGIRLGDDAAAAARMEFHDHLGAALGAMAVGLILMPLLGLSGTILALMGMKALSLLMNWNPIPV